MTKVNSPASCPIHTDIFTPLSPHFLYLLLCVLVVVFLFILPFSALFLPVGASLHHSLTATHKQRAALKCMAECSWPGQMCLQAASPWCIHTISLWQYISHSTAWNSYIYSSSLHLDKLYVVITNHFSFITHFSTAVPSTSSSHWHSLKNTLGFVL